MNFDSLEYFSVLAQERSFTRAAELLHITQQSLSSHIAGLEKELNCQLVVRRIPLELTYAGKTFLRYAEDIRRTQHTMQQELCDISQNQKGELRVGLAFTRSHVVLPRIIEAFQQEYPQVAVTLTETTNDALPKLVIDGAIDLAIGEFPKASPEVEMESFYDERIVLCFANDLLARCGLDFEAHEAEMRGGDLRALQDCPFVMGTAEGVAGRIGREFLHRTGLRPIVRASSENLETLLELCERGIGACFSPENLLHTVLSEEQLSRMHILHFDEGASYPIRFCYLRRPYQWSIIQEFIRVAREYPG